jgi:hypothetical protein
MPKVVSIGASAFEGAISLVKINSETTGTFIIPDSVTSIGLGAFRGVDLVTHMTLPFVGTSVNEVSKHNPNNGIYTLENSVFGAIFGYEMRSQSGGSNRTYSNNKVGTQAVGTTWQ